MNLFRQLYISALLACLAASPRVLSQEASGNAPTGRNSVSSAPQSGQIAPSDGVPSSGMVLGGNPPTSKTGTRKSAGTGNLRGSLSMGAIPGVPSHLCFQPGIGWQPVSMQAFGDTDKSSTPDTPGSRGSGTIEAKGSVTGGSSKPVYAQPSGTRQATSNDCPGMLTNSMTPGAAMNEMTMGKESQARMSVRSTNMNAGAQNWLQANSALNPASSTASRRLMMGLTTMPTGGTHVAERTGSGLAAAQTNRLKTHVFVSSIELRRMMRQAPDLQTRIELQELQDRLAKQSHIPTEVSKKRKAANEQGKNQHGNRLHPSRRLRNSDFATNMTKALTSHTYP